MVLLINIILSEKLLEFPQPLGNMINSANSANKAGAVKRGQTEFTTHLHHKLLKFFSIQQAKSEISLVLMLRFVRLWQERISSSSISVSTLACLRYGIKMHGRTPKEIRCRLSLISSHSSSSPISFRSGPSGTHSPAIWSVLWVCLPERYLPAAEGTAGMKTHPQLQRHLSHTCSWKKTDKYGYWKRQKEHYK